MRSLRGRAGRASADAGARERPAPSQKRRSTRKYIYKCVHYQLIERLTGGHVHQANSRSYCDTYRFSFQLPDLLCVIRAVQSQECENLCLPSHVKTHRPIPTTGY